MRKAAVETAIHLIDDAHALIDTVLNIDGLEQGDYTDDLVAARSAIESALRDLAGERAAA